MTMATTAEWNAGSVVLSSETLIEMTYVIDVEMLLIGSIFLFFKLL